MQELFRWQNLSRGFQGGFYISAPVRVFDEDGEITDLLFSVKQVDSSFFLLLKIEESRFICGQQECSFYSNWCLGEDFGQPEAAMEFAEYVVESYRKHQNLSRLPFTDLNHWIFERL